MYINDCEIECCGIREGCGMGEQVTMRGNGTVSYVPKPPLSHLNDLMNEGDFNWSHLIFSQAGKDAPYGETFAAYIRDHDLGEVAGMENFYVNPNSGNPLKVWVWAPNRDRIREHLKKEGK